MNNPNTTTLGQLRPGAIFVTEDGTYAVKSEYHYPNGIDPVADSEGVNATCECVLLDGGEYAHFEHGNATVVHEVSMPQMYATNQSTTATDEDEELNLYLIEEEQQPQAVVSIGHIDFRATFVFASNAHAVACYDALKIL